jgi:hypothetical protein
MSALFRGQYVLFVAMVSCISFTLKIVYKKHVDPSTCLDDSFLHQKQCHYTTCNDRVIRVMFDHRELRWLFTLYRGFSSECPPNWPIFVFALETGRRPLSGTPLRPFALVL